MQFISYLYLFCMTQLLQKIVLLLVVFAGLSVSSYSQRRAALPVSRHKIIVIAHRGDHTEVPENTLAAYEKAIEDGADYIETDLRTTKDGGLVIMHDATVNRMTDGKGNVKDLTHNEIKSLKIKAAGKEYSVPSFEEVLNICKNKIGIYLDFKDADPAKVFALIKEAGMQKNVVVYLNKEEQYTQWKQAAPKMPLMSSPPDSVKNKVSLQHFLEQRAISLMDGRLSDYDDGMILTAKENNVAIWLDVQSDKEGPPDWDAALQKGVNGMQSDHPGRLIQYLEEKHLR